MNKSQPRELEDQRIALVREFLESNPGRRVSLAEMTQYAHFSASRLWHLFKAATGMSPSRYSMILRMQWAREMIAAGSASLKEIAAQSGFSDQSHFTRAFRKAYGVNPTLCRNRVYESAFGCGSGYKSEK